MDVDTQVERLDEDEESAMELDGQTEPQAVNDRLCSHIQWLMTQMMVHR
jgi:hypothetical protein